MNRFDLTEVSVSLLWTLVWVEFYAICVQLLPYSKPPWKNVALGYKEACETRRNWFIWEATENDSKMAIMNRNATLPLMIIFLRECFFQKACLTCEKHMGTVWLKGKLLVGILIQTHQYRCSQNCYICFFEKHFFHILCYSANVHSWEMDKSTLQIFTCQSGNNDSLINPSLTKQQNTWRKEKAVNTVRIFCNTREKWNHSKIRYVCVRRTISCSIAQDAHEMSLSLIGFCLTHVTY